jgi:hypothetical protein
MTDTIHHNDHAAAIHRLIALRFYMRYVKSRHSAEFLGEDLAGRHGRLPSEREADEEYEAAALDGVLTEHVTSAGAAAALVQFAGVLAVDRLMGDVTGEPVIEDRDAFHQAVALANAAMWLNQKDTEEYAQRERTAGKPGLAEPALRQR